MRSVKHALLLMGLLTLFLLPACSGWNATTAKSAAKEIPFLGGTEWLHTCGENLVAVSRRDDVFLWDWGDLEKPPIKGHGGRGLATAFLVPDRIVTTVDPWQRPPNTPYPVLVKNLVSGSIEKQWGDDPAWYCEGMRTSVNGKFVVIRTNQNSNVTNTPGESRYRVGIIGPEADRIAWAPEIREKKGTLYVAESVPSEDGRFVATVGVNNGSWICLVEVGQERVAWEFVDDMDVGFKDAAFSPDSKAVYAGGGSGVLYTFDVATGKVKSRWLIGDGKHVEYGNRISRVAASPDGRLVAAGTGPDGAVYIWEVQTGNRLDVLQTRQSTIMGLTFGPDSKRLAVTGVENRTIEIWDVTQE